MPGEWQEVDFSVLEPVEEPRVRRLLRAAGAGSMLVAGWLADRIEDGGRWAANLVRLLPRRVGRVATTCGVGLIAVATLLPTALRVYRKGGREHFAPWLRARARNGATRLIQLMLEILDVFGTPELFAFVWRIIARVTPLSGAEIAAASSVLGPAAVRYHDVRVAEEGLLRWIFRRNGDRAFATFHTINLPRTGGHARENLPIVLHELVHVYQYERAGSRYIAESLLAQQHEGYEYGGAEGLTRAHAVGKQMRNFNREQQAQIVEDYFRSGVRAPGETAYDFFIDELRRGQI